MMSYQSTTQAVEYQYRHNPYDSHHSRVYDYFAEVNYSAPQQSTAAPTFYYPSQVNPHVTIQYFIGQCAYDATPDSLNAVFAKYAPSTQVVKIEAHKKGPKPTGAFFVTVVAGTEYELLQLHQCLRFTTVQGDTIVYDSAHVDTYDEDETRRILCFQEHRGETLDHLPVYRMTIEVKGGARSVPPPVHLTALGKRIARELANTPFTVVPKANTPKPAMLHPATPKPAMLHAKPKPVSPKPFVQKAAVPIITVPVVPPVHRG